MDFGDRVWPAVKWLCTPFFNSRETGSRFQLPKVPSNKDSNLSWSVSGDSLSGGFRCLQLPLTMPGMSALSYLASRISSTLLVAFSVLSGSWVRHVLCLSALLMLCLS